jgi:hypothetical protein
MDRPTILPAAPMDRRTFLKRAGIGAGAAVIAGVGGGLVWRSIDQSVFAPGSGPAYEPWRADLDGPPPTSLVAAAVLAANAHNTQPWKFAVTDERIDLFADHSRTMGAMDAIGRELQLSLGCALENLVLAARAHGLAPDVVLQPDPTDPGHVATIGLPAAERSISPLYRAIPLRHTNRAAYDTDRAIPASELDAISALGDVDETSVAWLTRSDELREFGQMTVDATAAILADADQARDDFAWYRQDWHEIEQHRDGITMDAAGLGEPSRSVIRLLPASSQEQMQGGWLDATRDRHVATAAAYGLVLVRDRHDAVQLLQAGRLFQRAHLHATDRGLAVQPLNQAFERADREAVSGGEGEFGWRLRELTPTGWNIVTAFRIGYPTSKAGISPRRPLQAVVVSR